MSGRASVIDGGTVEIADQRIRFKAIDAGRSRNGKGPARG